MELGFRNYNYSESVYSKYNKRWLEMIIKGRLNSSVKGLILIQ